MSYKSLPATFYYATSPIVTAFLRSYFSPMLASCTIKIHDPNSSLLIDNIDKRLVEGSEGRSRPVIHTMYHQHLPFLIPFHGSYGNRTLLIQGDAYMTPIVSYVQSTGMVVVRGGGKSDPPVIETLKEVLDSGSSVVLAVDGPAGPCYGFKSGAVVLAQASGCSIVHSYYRTTKGRNDESRWDKRLIPTYFDKIDVHVGRERFVSQEDVIEDVVEEMESDWREVIQEWDKRGGG